LSGEVWAISKSAFEVAGARVYFRGMKVDRDIALFLARAASQFPAVTLTGPR
jgi:hypothetical protein